MTVALNIRRLPAGFRYAPFATDIARHCKMSRWAIQADASFPRHSGRSTQLACLKRAQEPTWGECQSPRQNRRPYPKP